MIIIFKSLSRGSRGGFAAKLAQAWQVADSSNQRIIQKAFSDIFKYSPKTWSGLDISSAPKGIYWLKEDKESSPIIVFLESSYFSIFNNPTATKYPFKLEQIFYGPIQPPSF